MELDLEQIKAAARAAGGGEWSAMADSVYFGDGDLLATCSGNIGQLPEPVDEEQLSTYIAAASPAVVLALVERLERAERISPYAFWVTAVDEFDGLCPAEVMAGACLAQRTEAPTPAQRQTLDLPPIERFEKIKAYVARPTGGMA